MGFLGYPRPDGGVGIRNHVAVAASVSCANGVVEALYRELGIRKLTHTEGCGRGPQDLVNTTRTLMGLGRNPNVAAVLVVGLGCEFLKAPMIAGGIRDSKKPVETLVIQDSGGSQRTIEAALAICRRLLDEAGSIERREHDWDRLTVGFECGAASSAASRAVAPALGACADWLIARGATVIFPELGAMVGAAGDGSFPVASPGVTDRIAEVLAARRRTAQKVFGDREAARVEGALGAGLLALGARSRVDDVLDYGAAPSKKGLHLMDTPESDVFAVTGLAAGGAQVIVQTTDHGNPAGFPIVPVVKVSTRSELFALMEDDIDLDGGRPGTAEEVGREIADYLARIAGGERSKAEINEYEVMAIQTLGPAF